MKKLFCFLTALIAAVCLLSAGLTTGAYDDTADAVIDEDDLFSSGEEARLSEKISRLSGQYGLDLVILTVNDLGSAYSADDFVDAWRESYRGEDVLILMIYNARNRDTRTYTSLGYGLGYQATGNYFFDCIPDKTHIEKKLSADRFYDACDEYLSLAGRFLKENARGKPFSYSHKYYSMQNMLLASAVVLAVVLIGVFCYMQLLKGRMKTARHATQARTYVKPDSFALTNSRDIFLYSHTSRIRIQSQSSGSPGGSGRSVGSSGGGGGGTRRF